MNQWYEFKQKVIKSLEIGHWLIEQNFAKDPLSKDVKLEATSLIEVVNMETETTVDLNICNDENLTHEVFNESSDKSLISDIKLKHEVDILQESGTSNVQIDTSKPEFICKICNESFPKLRTLFSHRRRLHNSKDYECPKCDKMFTRTEVLNNHLKRHYGLKNFKCEYCGRGFYTKYNLAEHLRIHTGERPFKCEQCEKTFTRIVLLNKHIKKVY